MRATLNDVGRPIPGAAPEPPKRRQRQQERARAIVRLYRDGAEPYELSARFGSSALSNALRLLRRAGELDESVSLTAKVAAREGK